MAGKTLFMDGATPAHLLCWAAAICLLASPAASQGFMLSTPEHVPIPVRGPLPQLQTLSGHINLTMTATELEVGPAVTMH